ncbi:unnamed protein product [Linum tenue]|uniref:F-box domain-containing protein n=1 Tax=Linum tenue TaxID=586396 RepID=A0AAV0IBU9_9ROSI|nr:unnamed protein product [Linum tenue]
MAEAAAVEIDRLSDLPDNILHHVLSFLDTVTIVKTSILSRRWRCLWKDVPVLCFQRKGFRSKLGFEEHVNRILANRSHHATVREIRLDYYSSGLSWEEPDAKVFDSVLRYAASSQSPGGMISRLHHLSIRNPPVFDSFYRRFTDVIASICTHRHHETLRTLNMHGVDVALVPMTAASGFQMLTTLQLRSCEFHDPDPFGGFPCLNHLKLFNCTSSPSGFAVLGPHLVDLEIDSPFLSVSDGLIRVSAPKLKSFRFEDQNLRSRGYPTLDLPALDHATIHFHWHEYLLVAPGCRSYVSREGSIRARLNLFGDLHNAESLILCFDSSTEVSMSMMIMKCVL